MINTHTQHTHTTATHPHTAHAHHATHNGADAHVSDGLSWTATHTAEAVQGCTDRIGTEGGCDEEEEVEEVVGCEVKEG